MFSNSSDIVAQLRAGHAALRAQMAAMTGAATLAERKKTFAEFLPLLESHTFAMEETLIARALSEETLRAHALECLEEHDLNEFEAAKIQKAATDDQWEAGCKVLCALLERHFEKEEEEFFPAAEQALGREERAELGERYAASREKLKLAPIIQLPIRTFSLQEESGRIGYFLAWLLGVPAWVLLMVFLIRGH